MDCKQIREELSAYIDGMLTEPVLSRVEAHLRSCPGCAAEMEELREVVGMVRALGEVSAPVGFRGQVMARLDGGVNYAAGRSGLQLTAGLFRRFSKWGQLSVVAAVLVVGIGISLLWGKSLTPGLHSYGMGSKSGMAETENLTEQKSSAGQAENGKLLNQVGLSDSSDTAKAKTNAVQDTGGIGSPNIVQEDRDIDTVVKSSKNDSILNRSAADTPPMHSQAEVPQVSPGAAGKRPSVTSRSPAVKGTSAGDSGKIVSGGTFKIEVNDPAAAEIRITSLAAELGGRVEKAEFSAKATGETFGVVIPGRQFDLVVAALEETGQVVGKQIITRDVSKEYSDLETRISSLEMEEKTATAADLSQVTTELAQLKQQLAAMEAEIDYAYISVELSTKG